MALGTLTCVPFVESAVRTKHAIAAARAVVLRERVAGTTMRSVARADADVTLLGNMLIAVTGIEPAAAS